MRSAKTVSVVVLTSLLAQPSFGIEFESISLSSLGRAVGLGCGPGYHARPCAEHKASYYNRVTACAQTFGQSDRSLACYDHTHPNRFWRFPAGSGQFPSGHGSFQPSDGPKIPFLSPLLTDEIDANDDLDEDEADTILDKLELGDEIDLPDPSSSDLPSRPTEEIEPIVPKRASPSPSDGANRRYTPEQYRAQIRHDATPNRPYPIQPNSSLRWQPPVRQPAKIAAHPQRPVGPHAAAAIAFPRQSSPVQSSPVQSWSGQSWPTRQFNQPQRQQIMSQPASQNAKNVFWY